MVGSGRGVIPRARLLVLILIAGVAIGSALIIQGSQSNHGANLSSSQTASNHNASPSSSRIANSYPAGLVTVTVGQPVTLNMTLGSQSSFTTFPAEQVFPLTITSPQTVPINLTAETTPLGVWIHFVPNHLEASPSGSHSQLVIAGAVRPLIPSSNNQTISIRASYGNSSTAVSLTIIRWLQLSIIHSPGPIEFANSLVVGADSPSSETYGAVYEPIGTTPNSTLVVNFSALGIMQNGKIVPMPSWLNLVYSNQSLILVPDKPTYFTLGARPIHGLPGNYVLVIQESIAGEQFTTNLELAITR
jgi:hypothetical protein